MAGDTLKNIGVTDPMKGLTYTSIKESVLPFTRFSGVDIILGPEMMSTGEVMGISDNFGVAFAKAQAGAGQILPKKGKVFISVQDTDKRNIVFLAKKLCDLGFELVATSGTAKILGNNNVNVVTVKKMNEGKPSIMDMIKNGEIALIINTPFGKKPHKDGALLRGAAVKFGTPCITTLAGTQATVNGIESMLKNELKVCSLQEYYAKKND